MNHCLCKWSLAETFRDGQIKVPEGHSLSSVSKDPHRYPHRCHLLEAVYQISLNDHKYMHLLPVGDQGGNQAPDL